MENINKYNYYITLIKLNNDFKGFYTLPESLPETIFKRLKNGGF